MQPMLHFEWTPSSAHLIPAMQYILWSDLGNKKTCNHYSYRFLELLGGFEFASP